MSHVWKQHTELEQNSSGDKIWSCERCGASKIERSEGFTEYVHLETMKPDEQGRQGWNAWIAQPESCGDRLMRQVLG